ncbi:RAMP superfamily CRISPR-associated protein [Rhodococcus xishaensis]|uniref:RAMP superfamily CRISPR-associated protein n=1 Tax=Rhodococcus xishaensis TaxID=2487364 RepID=UPI0022A81665|nr:RAMP superfamily CRISPR-associated protein [Rhodococcus xishaensis]
MRVRQARGGGHRPSGTVGAGVGAEMDNGSDIASFEVEAVAPGTRFESWVQLDRGSELDRAFAADVLAELGRRGWLGGRTASGHGQISVVAAPDPSAGVGVDWRSRVADRRDDALAALRGLAC